MIQGKFILAENTVKDLVKNKTEYYDNNLLEQVKSLRKDVFILEQHKTEQEEYDEYDKTALFCIVLEDDHTVKATGRLNILEDGTYKIGRIAVDKNARGKKYGDMVVRMLVNRAIESGAQKVLVGAQIKAVGFYESIGFHISGEEYIEAGIPHIPMYITINDFIDKKPCHSQKK